MLNLPQKTFSKIKNKLLRQQREIEENLQSIEKDDPAVSDGLAETTESGTASWMADMHSRAQALKSNLLQVLNRTRQALVNLRSGKYGKCERCGHQIEPDRLEALPTAAVCLFCSKKVR